MRGYHLNNEMIWSKFGIANLYIHKINYNMKKSLPKTYVVKDLSFIALSEKCDAKTEKLIILNYYRGLQNITQKYLLKNLE
jgi:hypothetical protein